MLLEVHCFRSTVLEVHCFRSTVLLTVVVGSVGRFVDCTKTPTPEEERGENTMPSILTVWFSLPSSGIKTRRHSHRKQMPTHPSIQVQSLSWIQVLYWLTTCSKSIESPSRSGTKMPTSLLSFTLLTSCPMMIFMEIPSHLIVHMCHTWLY